MEYRAELRIGLLSRGECKPVVCCHIALAVNHIRRTEPAVFHQEGTARLPDQTCVNSGEFHPLHGDVAEDQIVSIRHGCTVGARLGINDGTCGIAGSGAVGNFENRTVNLGPPCIRPDGFAILIAGTGMDFDRPALNGQCTFRGSEINALIRESGDIRIDQCQIRTRERDPDS